MLRKNSVLIGIIIANILLLVAMFTYPGGSQIDLNSEGYDFINNYFCDLFGVEAQNGMENSANNWAIVGIFFLSISFAIFFINFSTKIPSKVASNIIKYSGILTMVFTFLVVTPLHDLMILIGITFCLICYFYITVFVLKSKLLLLKILSIVTLLVMYLCSYIYFTQQYLIYLPLMQKVSYMLNLIWILGLEYFTVKADFEVAK